MAEFLTTRGIGHHLEEIIKGAKNRLTLITPFLQTSSQLFERLKDADDRKVQIQIVYGKSELQPRQQDSLERLNNLFLLYYENLHAKCYFNESKMLITSMNMYEYSEVNNKEMGILIDSGTDHTLFKAAKDESELIIKNALLEKAPKTPNAPVFAPAKPARGFCLRCEERIPFNPLRPYCLSCYNVWSQYSNPEYLENVCHRCGQYTPTSMSKPECGSCFKLSKAGK